MATVTLSMMTSLDGCIARRDGNLDWFRSDRDFEDEMFDVLHTVDGMIFGRVSYELLAQYWPTAETSTEEAPGGFSTKERGIEFTRLMNSIPKIVFSRTLAEADWGPSTIVREVSAEEVERFGGKKLVLFAGAELASSFMRLDLIDAYHLLVHPVILGNGQPLFRNLVSEQALTIVRTRQFSSGVALLQYARDRRTATP